MSSEGLPYVCPAWGRKEGRKTTHPAEASHRKPPPRTPPPPPPPPSAHHYPPTPPPPQRAQRAHNTTKRPFPHETHTPEQRPCFTSLPRLHSSRTLLVLRTTEAEAESTDGYFILFFSPRWMCCHLRTNERTNEQLLFAFTRTVMSRQDPGNRRVTDWTGDGKPRSQPAPCTCMAYPPSPSRICMEWTGCLVTACAFPVNWHVGERQLAARAFIYVCMFRIRVISHDHTTHTSGKNGAGNGISWRIVSLSQTRRV